MNSGEVTFWKLINLISPYERICIHVVHGRGTDSEYKRIVYEGLAKGIGAQMYEYYADCPVLLVYGDDEDCLNAKTDVSGKLVIEYLNEINIEIDYPKK